MMKTIFATAVLAALAGPALAVSFEGSLTQGGTTVTDYSATGLISFDVDWANLAPVLLDYRIDAEDLLQPLAFNAVLRNYSGSGLQGEVAAGFEFLRASTIRMFAELDVTLPFYTARPVLGTSATNSEWVPSVFASVGIGFGRGPGVIRVHQVP